MKSVACPDKIEVYTHKENYKRQKMESKNFNTYIKSKTFGC